MNSHGKRLKPNIVYILADDLGYGDVGCLNPVNGKIPTPNIDRLAKEGIIFTDAHASSSVCSPSRYGILTGRYNWRSRLQRGIVTLFEEPLISPDRLTVAGFLKEHDYHTACVGKWHLGWNWPEGLEGSFQTTRTAIQTPAGNEQKRIWEKLFMKPVTGGPTSRGFDYYFGVDVPNWPPYCFIENEHTIGIPCEMLPAKLIGNRQASIPGPAVSGWELERVLPTLIDRACDYISDRAMREEPFFLYLPLTSPHTPLAVNDEWKGRSHLNLYADFVMETDAMVGKIQKALDDNEIADNTLVIFTSDNGCAPYIGVDELEKMGHYPSACFRGYKSDIWDGGHRIPFIARWPEIIAAGSVCPHMICLTDFMATCADTLNATIPMNAAVDSVSILSLFQGGNSEVRDSVIHHSINGKFAIRRGRWKLILCAGSGGWASPHDETAIKNGLPSVQLYDIISDPGEKKNLQAEFPDIVQLISLRLKQYVMNGRSTPGPKQENDVDIDMYKN